MDDQTYEAGQRSAFSLILRECLRHLGYDNPERVIVEREEAISVLRQVCEDHGDNDWDPKLHLADIIEKHLAKHLGGR